MADSKVYEVLVVEDNECDRILLREALRDCGYPHRVHFATSPEEGTRRLAQQPIDIVLLDTVFPQGDCRDVVRFARAAETLRDIPIIVFSSEEAESAVHNAYGAGVNCYVFKARDLDGLFATIKSVMHFCATILPQTPRAAHS